MNTKLMNVGWDAIMKMGFKEERDGTGDPRGTSYVMKRNGFVLYLDAWFDVFLIHQDSDPIQLKVDNSFDLSCAISFIGEEK